MLRNLKSDVGIELTPNKIPSNILLKRFKPHVWLSLNMLLFGLVTLLQGVVQSYSGLLATRFFLGVFEAGLVLCLRAVTLDWSRYSRLVTY